MFVLWVVCLGLTHPRAKPKRVLIVDDEPDIQMSIKSLLEVECPGFEVLTAGDADEALQVLRWHEVDLVITDFRMPGMDGFQLLDRVKVQVPRARRALMTAYDPHWEEHNRLRQLDFYLRKPIELERLKQAMHRVLA